jgi:hypothetical protein
MIDDFMNAGDDKYSWDRRLQKRLEPKTDQVIVPFYEK